MDLINSRHFYQYLIDILTHFKFIDAITSDESMAAAIKYIQKIEQRTIIFYCNRTNGGHYIEHIKSLERFICKVQRKKYVQALTQKNTTQLFWAISTTSRKDWLMSIASFLGANYIQEESL